MSDSISADERFFSRIPESYSDGFEYGQSHPDLNLADYLDNLDFDFRFGLFDGMAGKEFGWHYIEKDIMEMTRDVYRVAHSDAIVIHPIGTYRSRLGLFQKINIDMMEAITKKIMNDFGRQMRFSSKREKPLKKHKDIERQRDYERSRNDLKGKRKEIRGRKRNNRKPYNGRNP